ncbi:MAG: sugar MFS transporter [Verrucomicrobiota bacterium]
MATLLSARPTSSVSHENQTYRGPFALMSILFFLWGFMTVWNDILIPRFKEAFELSYFQAMLVQFAFFGAYGVGSLIYYLISMTSGDPINRIGYKNGVILGLLIAAGGSSLFYPAATLTSYPLFLIALFIVGLGFAMLQIAANPYVTILGPERTASSRLNLSQAFNSFGTATGPILGSWLIYEVFHSSNTHSADSVKVPYLCFSGIFLLIALLFKVAHLPNFTNDDQVEGGIGALKHPHTALGMLAIFMYVGGEVSVGSAIVNFLGSPRLGSLPLQTASAFLSFFWGGLMIGRFMGAVALSELSRRAKHLIMSAIPLGAFILIIALPEIASFFHLGWADQAGTLCHFSTVKPYGICLILLLVSFFLGEASPQRMLSLFSGLIISLLITGVVAEGEIAKWAVLGVGLFCSVMWSNIFSLAIEGLGALKSQASSLLVMAILGGAILPPIQGAVADHFGIQISFVIPILAFAYIAFYGLYGYRAGRDLS